MRIVISQTPFEEYRKQRIRELTQFLNSIEERRNIRGILEDSVDVLFESPIGTTLVLVGIVLVQKCLIEILNNALGMTGKMNPVLLPVTLPFSFLLVFVIIMGFNVIANKSLIKSTRKQIWDCEEQSGEKFEEYMQRELSEDYEIVKGLIHLKENSDSILDAKYEDMFDSGEVEIQYLSGGTKHSVSIADVEIEEEAEIAEDTLILRMNDRSLLQVKSLDRWREGVQFS